MADQEFDVFLSSTSKDVAWCEAFLVQLHSAPAPVSIRVWFIPTASDTVKKKGLAQSRKLVTVWSQNFLGDTKLRKEAEKAAKQNATTRVVLPVVIEDCNELPDVPWFDFRNPEDYHLSLRALIQAIDLPPADSDPELVGDMSEEKLDPTRRGKMNLAKGKRFENEVAKLYELHGYQVKRDRVISGMQLDLLIEQNRGRRSKDVVECKDTRIGADERDQIISRYHVFQRQGYGCIAVSSQGYAADALTALETAGVDCWTYQELLKSLVPLDNYATDLIEELEQWQEETWQRKDWFVRPDVRQDITGQDFAALKYISDWLGHPNKNQLVILGDAGSGKSTLVRFLVYNLAQRYLEDPVRHPAPMLIPLGGLYKETTLEAIIHEHFNRRNLPGVNFRRFEHLVREGRIILFFDAFDEMVDRVTFEEGFSNFREISRAAEAAGKVVVTCRVNYFKDVEDQQEVIEQAYRAAGTPYYRKLREKQGNEVVYLKPFDDTKIYRYLAVARPNPDEDWKKIEQIYDLKGLAQLPLLLTMITDSLDDFKPGEKVDAAKLYQRYTDKWIERENAIGNRFKLRGRDKMRLMLELAWRIWNNPDRPMRYRELVSFIEEMRQAGVDEFRGRESEDIASAIHLRSFLRRDGDSAFTFIHRSFMEYFLARRTFEGLTNPDGAEIGLLNTNRFNKRIIHFLTMIDAEDKIVPPLQSILTSPYRSNISENALEILYWGGRIRCEMEEDLKDVVELQKILSTRLPNKALLSTAKLSGVVLECADLTGADLTGADLTNSKLNHVALDNAFLRAATLSDASVEMASARDAEFVGATLGLVSFRESDLAGADFREAKDVRPESFLNAKLDNVRGLKLPGLGGAKNLLPIVQYVPNFAAIAVSYSPDGSIIAAGGDDGNLYIYRSEDGVLLRVLEGHSSSVRSVAFSPDGETLASGSSDKSVKLWQVKSGKEIGSLRGHSASVNSVAFSPDGETLASGSDDKSVKLWQVKSGELLATLIGNLGAVLAAAFAPNGRFIVSAGRGGRLQFWDHESGKTFLYRYYFAPGAWLDLLPDGRFDASPAGLRYLAYTGMEELTYYPAESLVKEFHSPEAVAKVLAKYT